VIRSFRMLLVAALLGLSLMAGVAAAKPHKPHANASCDYGTANDYAWGFCHVLSGQARIRADCAYAPDRYSRWTSGTGYFYLQTGGCLFSVRRAVLELRG